MRSNPKKAYFLLCCLIVSVFTVNLAWNSFHSLSLKSRVEKFHLEQDFGFYEEESDGSRKFRWTRDVAGLSMYIEDSILHISLLASHPDIDEKPINVTLIISKDYFDKKKILGNINITNRNWHTYDFRLQEELVKSKAFMIVKVSRTWQPYKKIGTPDLRRLGIAVGEIRFGNTNDE